jgi:multimeric flavodoxin WrbA
MQVGSRLFKKWGSMKIIAIMGSYRKGKTIDTLMDKAIEGAQASNSKVEVEKI